MKKHNRNIRFLLLVGALLFSAGCAEALALIDSAARGASWLSSAIAMADAGQDAYFARHPSPENEPKVLARLLEAKQADASLKAVLALGESVSKGELNEAKDRALSAYSELYELLELLGVLSAKPPPGGSETEQPRPKPVHLPSPGDLRGKL